MTLFDLLYYGAAAWYLAYCLTSTDGPFKVFQRVRGWLPLGGLTACIICLMPWIAIGLRFAGTNLITDGLAIAGISLWIHSYSGWRVKI